MHKIYEAAICKFQFPWCFYMVGNGAWGKLLQWLFKINYLLERSIGHRLDVSVNPNYFPTQCSVIASAALTRDQVLHFLPRKKKNYSLDFHVIDIKHLLQCNKLLYYLKEYFLPNTWARQLSIMKSKMDSYRDMR